MYPSVWNGTPSTMQIATQKQINISQTDPPADISSNKIIKEVTIHSRRGYDARELIHSFSVNLLDTGPLASGKLLHYTADLVCSGGVELLRKLCWDFAFDHIGVAQPRIFIFLRRRILDIFAAWAKQSPESFFYSVENQRMIAEMVLVLQACPRRTKPKIPIVSKDTHENDVWLRSCLRATEKESVRKVFKQGVDQYQMYHAANEIIQATQEGATERALWWLRWIFEEDAAVRQRNKTGLTTLHRGNSSGSGTKKSLIGTYIAAVLAECYKELASKGLIRLHEEFQCLIELSRVATGNEVGLSGKRQTDCLALMIQILAEIPRWKNPSSPPLLTLESGMASNTLAASVTGIQSGGSDDIILRRAVSQAEMFWREILALPALEKSLPAAMKAKAAETSANKKNMKKTEVSQKMSQMDDFYSQFYQV